MFQQPLLNAMALIPAPVLVLNSVPVLGLCKLPPALHWQEVN